MRVLALDTTTLAGSVAIVDDDHVMADTVGDPTRPHAERLPGDLLDALAAAHLSSADIDIFAIVAGPGSFTGLRIGIATMQGLAMVHGRRIVAVSALEALAEAAAQGEPAGTLVGTWMDAHRHDVFSALWRVTASPVFSVTHLEALEPATVEPPLASFERWQRDGQVPAVVIGDGAVLYQTTLGEGIRVMPAPALAPIVGRMAVARALAGQTVDPAGVQPVYVRRPDAEVARDARRLLAEQQSGGSTT
jgi:tRNA threonylcarbamoyladenosine biosynthesis protein TsaB